MAATPLIKPIQNDQGIMYVMQSAMNDMTSVFSQDNKRFRMSKFALVNIPTLQIPDVDGDNATQVNSAGDYLIYENASIYGNNMTYYLAESFENYCLNMEAMLISNPSYDTSNPRTVSERVFWKWVKEMGAIRYRQANALEMDQSTLPTNKVLFVEEDAVSSTLYTYDRAVKYIADIEVVNTVQNQNTYTEFYIYIPTQVGSTPYVLFDSVTDTNYVMSEPGNSNQYYHNVTAGALNEAYLVGRNYDDTHPFGLDMNAFYDYAYDDSEVYWEISAYDPSFGAGAGTVMSPGYWFNDTSRTPYAYYTDNLVTDSNGNSIGDVRNIKVTRTRENPAGTSVSFIRSCLDGVVIDFNTTDYKAINENSAISTFADFNEINGSLNFDYNAILLYYEIYDPANPTAAVVTNLYGIQFLSKPIQTGTYWKLPSITKNKPDVFNKINGNCFAHKENLKFDTSMEGAAVEKSINDYGTFSLNLYIDALTAMKNMAQVYNDNLAYLTNTASDVNSLKSLMINDTNSQELLLRIQNLEKSYLANQALFNNTNNVMGMVQQLYDMYNNILNNNTALTVNYNFDPMTLNNMVVLNQEYNFRSSLTANIGNIVALTSPISLVKYTNYYRHALYSGSTPVDISLSQDVTVYIDDTAYGWKTGQAFDISFATRINTGSFSIYFKTDALNKMNNGSYGTSVLTMDATYFNSTNDYMPIVRIICVDQQTLTFVVDKIR